MREIKFRAWDKKEKIMYIPNHITFNHKGYGYSVVNYINDSDLVVEIGEGVELMQFTGLKDKNGKEIYEGDIVRREEDEIQIDEVEFDYQKARWYPLCFCDKYIGTLQMSCEVIGNIYENPELLDKEDKNGFKSRKV